MLKKLLALAAANFIAPVIQFLASPLITRIYGPKIFGSFALVYAASVVISMVLSGLIYQGLVSEERDEDVARLYFESMAVTFICAVLIVVSSWAVGRFVSIPSEFLPATALGLIICLGQVQTFYLARIDRSDVISRAILAKAVILVSTQALVGWRVRSEGALISAAAISELAALGLSVFAIRGQMPRFGTLREVASFRMARKHKNYPVKFLPSQLIAFCVNTMPLAIVSSFGASQVAGHFAFSMRLSQAPAGSIISAIRAIYWRVSRGAENSRINIRAVGLGHLISILGCLLILAIPDKLTAALFGRDWVGLMDVLAFVFLWVAGSVIAQFPAEVVKHNNSQGTIFIVEIAGSAAKCAALALFFTGMSLQVALQMFCVVAYACSAMASVVLTMKAGKLASVVPLEA